MEMSISSPDTPATMTAPPSRMEVPEDSCAVSAATVEESSDSEDFRKKDALETQDGPAVVPCSYILLMLDSILRKSTRDSPIHDLSPFHVGNMRLSFSDTLEDAPHAVPLMDRDTFLSRAKELLHSDWDRELDPDIMPSGIPDYFLECDDKLKPRPALCWGLLFHWAYLEFSERVDAFFRDCLEPIKRQSPDLVYEGTARVTRPTTLVPSNPWDEQLYMGERDEKIGDLIWKAFGGFDEDLALDGVFMSSRMMEGFEVPGGRNVVSKAELYVMLLEMGCMIEVYEDLGWYPDTALPTTMVINFTDKYARVIQGALVRPVHDPSIIELRISVSDTLEYLDDDGNVIPDVWLQLLRWTFCHSVGAKKAPVDTRDAPATASMTEDAKLVVPKVRAEKTDDTEDGDEDEALRQASKSTAASSTAEEKEKQKIARPSRLPRRTFTYSTNPSTSSGSSSD